MARFIGERLAREVAAKGEKAAVCGSWAGLYPALCEYMTQTVWAGGEARATTTLLVFVEEGVWKACVTDRDAEPRQVGFVSAQTPEGLLAAVEARLANGTVEWRQSYGGRGKKK